MSESHLGTVVSVQGNTVTVAFERSEMCAHCGACQSDGGHKMLLTVENTADAGVGDKVSFSSASGNVAKASLLAYLFPLVMLILGVWLGSLISELWAILMGIGACLIAYGTLRLLDNRWNKRKTFTLKMNRVIKKEDMNNARTDE